ncbi:Hypothetical predicted protein [Mytilus galloprovincialis]|uniref:SGNH hydrolase-type esterase domain-containing protein n=1 Tax=Mytilus galloprovincialis TaxID=29158 RepID=A0A8B6EJ94_MYTGA|nr:Hypothetical predicted protein [Mytilus galloprovincialis]
MNNIRKQLSKIDEIPYLNNNLTSVPVILSDSKGRCLQNQLNFRNSIKWCYKSGASTKEQFNFLKQNLAELINQYTNITLFVWLGTNDLTKKERDGSISLKSSGNDSVNHIYSIYKEIYFFVRNFEKVKLIYIEVPVYSIYWWNVFHNHSNPEQFREDDLCLHTQIEQLNIYIRDINRILHVHSPSLSNDLVQTRKQGKRKHTFSSYTFTGYYDGIHPRPELSRLWLLKLCRVFNMYCV